VVPASDKDPEGWGATDKFTVVLETAGLNATELSAYCRERGLYPEQVECWRQASQDANEKPVLTLKEQKELERLRAQASDTRDGEPFQATHLFLTSLHTTPEALLQLVRDRWSIEGWHWIRDTQLHEDAHRYRGNGAGVMATLRIAAMNLLRLAGFRSIRTGLQAVMHDITVLLAMARRQPQPDAC
jgi:predicted transposase YbfD/YdcC